MKTRIDTNNLYYLYYIKNVLQTKILLSFLWCLSADQRGTTNGQMSLDSISTPAFYMFFDIYGTFYSRNNTFYIRTIKRSFSLDSTTFTMANFIRKVSNTVKIVHSSHSTPLTCSFKSNWSCRRSTHPSPTSHLTGSLTQPNSSFMIMI